MAASSFGSLGMWIRPINYVLKRCIGSNSSVFLWWIAGRLCDNLLTCVVRAWDYYSKPFFVAPAMNTLMWKNRFMERHIMSTGELGVSLIPPVTRRLAWGDYGNGAMAEPSLIYYAVRLF